MSLDLREHNDFYGARIETKLYKHFRSKKLPGECDCGGDDDCHARGDVQAGCGEVTFAITGVSDKAAWSQNVSAKFSTFEDSVVISKTRRTLA